MKHKLTNIRAAWRRAFALPLAATLALAGAAQAQSTWKLTGGGAWGTAGNWDPSGVPSAANALVNLTNDITSDAMITLGANRTVGTMNIGDSDGTHKFDISGNTLTFDVNPNGNATLNITSTAANATHNISSAVTIAANDNLIIINNKVGDGGVNFSANIAGTSRTVTLNAVSGATGAISFGGSNGFLKVVVNANAIFNSTRVADDRALGATTANVDAVTLNGGSLRVGADGTIAILASRGIALGTGGGTFLVDASRNWTVNSIVTGWGALTVDGGAGVLTLNGANTYQGDTTVRPNTTLKATNIAALPSATTLRLVSNSGANHGKLDLSFSGERTVRALYFDGVRQAAGTYGFTDSGAANINTDWFTGGIGTLNVLPETSAGQGSLETFDSTASATANGWVGAGNTTGGNNIQWNNSNNAGGTAGEVLGVFSRSQWDVTHYYADTTIGTLARTNTLRMQGKFRLTDSNFDGGFFLGFFQPGVVPSGNSVGISFAEPSSGGGPFRGYAGVNGTGGAGSSQINITQSTQYTFDLIWAGNPDGSGTLTGTVAGTDIGTVSVGAGAGTFEAFGLLAGGSTNDPNRKTGNCYFDDLTYGLAYPVTYNDNGSTGGTAPASQTKVHSVPLTLASQGDLVRSGFSFAGWNTQTDGLGTDYAEGASYTTNSSLTLYAKWTNAATYTITYDGNGNDSGAAPTNQTKVANMILTLATNSGNLAKIGHTFAGWNTQSDGMGTNYPAGGNFTTNANTTLYAKWTINTYTVTYSGNTSDSGTVPVDGSSPYNFNSTVTVLGNTGSLAKTGHTFGGWNTAANGSGTSYVPTATFDIAADTTLYAEWTPDPFTVTFDANGATSGTVPDDQTKLYDVPLTLATNSGGLVKSGFAFAGWNTAADAMGSDYPAGGNYSANTAVTLYAKWVTPATIYWDNTGANGNWSGVNNWSTDLAGTTDPAAIASATDLANFSATPIEGTAQTVSLNANRSVHGLNVLAAVTASTSLQGGGTNRTLTIGSAGIVNNSSASLTLGSGTTNQNVNLILAGNQSIANNGTANISINNTVSGLGSPTITNIGTGTNYVGMGALQSTVGKIVQDSATSKLGLRANSSGFGGDVEILKGTLSIGTSAFNLGNTYGQVILGGSGTDAATLDINDNTSQTYAAKPIVLGTTSGPLTIRLRDDSGVRTHTIQGAISGNNNLTLESQASGSDKDDNLTFTMSEINNAGTITHIGDSEGDLTIHSVIGSNVTGVIQNSATSRMVLGGLNSYSGPTTVSAGTLRIGLTDTLPDATAVSIAAATLDAANDVTDTVGTLDVTAAATINLGTAAALAFADSSGVHSGTWAGTLNITGTFGAASIRFGTTSSGLTSGQLAKISVNGSGLGTYTLDASGYLVAGAVSGFPAWQAANSTVGGLNDDHDNDGVDNGVEWFLGGNTNTTGFTPLPGVTNTGGTLSVTWVRHPDYPGFPGNYGTDIRVETSTALANPWPPATVGVGAGFVEITGNSVKYTFPTGPAKNFARLVITGP